MGFGRRAEVACRYRPESEAINSGRTELAVRRRSTQLLRFSGRWALRHGSARTVQCSSAVRTIADILAPHRGAFTWSLVLADGFLDLNDGQLARLQEYPRDLVSTGARRSESGSFFETPCGTLIHHDEVVVRAIEPCLFCELVDTSGALVDVMGRNSS
jgi:hypothetical protein